MPIKAYQLKAAIKNQKPPIWRRCVVPAGITYSQLSLILAEIMGKTKEEDFEFEFYQKKIRFGENGEGKQVRRSYYYSTAEASEFYIDEFLDTEDWFSFYYGDDLKLRVTIEKCVDVSFSPFIVKVVDMAVADAEAVCRRGGSGAAAVEIGGTTVGDSGTGAIKGYDTGTWRKEKQKNFSGGTFAPEHKKRDTGMGTRTWYFCKLCFEQG